jgi:hypothetical protein
MAKKNRMFSNEDTPVIPREPVSVVTISKPTESTKPVEPSRLKKVVMMSGEVSPVHSLPLVLLDVYCLTSGKRPDQTKGFMAWAKSQGLKAMTVPEWHSKWQEFQGRTV